MGTSTLKMVLNIKQEFIWNTVNRICKDYNKMLLISTDKEVVFLAFGNHSIIRETTAMFRQIEINSIFIN